MLVKKEGQTHEYSATSSTDIASGHDRPRSGIAGSGLIVEPRPRPDAGHVAADPPTTAELTLTPTARRRVADQASPTEEG